MNRFARGLAPVVVALAGWWSLSAPAAGPPPRPLSREQVAKLVADLGAADTDARAEAARRLGELPHVPLALREAAAPTDKADRAVRARAERALAALERRLAPRVLARAAAWAKEGEVDLAREAVAVWGPKAGEDEGWQVMTTLAEEILKRQRKVDKRMQPPPLPRARVKLQYVVPVGDFAAYKKAARPKLLEGAGVAVDDGTALVRAAGRVRLRGARALQSSLVVCSGDLAASDRGPAPHQMSGLGSSVAFVGGDADAGMVAGALLVCSGEARLGGVSNAVVIARGPVTISRLSGLSGLNVVVSGGKIAKHGSATPDVATLEEGKARPLGFVRFFETGRVGVEVGKAKNRDGALVTKLDAAKGFAKAGLWKGDVITEVDGKQVKTPEELRRALLRRLVEGGEAKLRVFRDGEWLTLYVTPRL